MRVVHQTRQGHFLQPKFKDYAHDNLVLVELDFPRKKSQPTEERKQNVQLAQQYEVPGFPTIVVLNSSGQRCGSSRLFPRRPRGVNRAAAKIAKGLSTPRSNLPRIDSALEQIRAAVAKRSVGFFC